ncbi:hypothetical protein ACIBJF_11335 [Streptomyces sp. NPDC050743]|uniref:hypothetical protein n=1 Tax=Streptomyces sp. NPDC050743 TaxID=3365634 RepID=UPI0037B7FD6B
MPGSDRTDRPHGPQGATGAAGPCADIDAQQDSADFELRAAVKPGVPFPHTFVGIRDLRGNDANPPLRWTDLSGLPGYPNGTSDMTGVACGVSINGHSASGNNQNPIKIDIIICGPSWTFVTNQPM